MINLSNTVVLEGGSVEYSIEDAAVLIDDVIEALGQAQARAGGAEYVTMESGNYRGAKLMKFYASVDWAEYLT